MLKIGIMIAAFIAASIMFVMLVRASANRKSMFARYLLGLFALIILFALVFCAGYTSTTFADFVAAGADATSGLHHKAALGWGAVFGVLPAVIGTIYMIVTYVTNKD